MEEKARKFVELMGMHNIPDAIIAAHVNTMRDQFGGDDLPDEPKRALEIVEQAFINNKSALIASFINAYATTFTEEDLDQLITFHESVIGRRLAELGPVAQQKVMDANEQWSVDVMKSVEGELSAVLSPTSS